MTDLSALPPAVTLPVGGRVLVRLPSYSGSGNAWSARCLDGSGVAHLQVQVGPATQEGYAVPPDEPPDAAPAPETLVVEGVEVGEARWQLVLARSFAPAAPTATHELRVTVRRAGPGEV